MRMLSPLLGDSGSSDGAAVNAGLCALNWEWCWLEARRLANSAPSSWPRRRQKISAVARRKAVTLASCLPSKAAGVVLLFQR
jgi:hypothetical protein